MATFRGKVAAISPLKGGTTKSGNTWQKIDVVLTYDNTRPEYPKSILFSVMNDNIQKMGFEDGKEYDVEVDFNVREWEGNYYMSATCWKASLVSVQNS